MAAEPMRVSLVIQAGGKSLRMGEDKALKPFLGRPLIQRVVEKLAPLADETLVTTNVPAGYAFLYLRLVPDKIPGLGALGGLYTAIAAASHPIVAVAACDLPFVSVALFRFAIDTLIREAADVVVPLSDGGLEPMHAVYRRDTCLPVIQSAVQARRLKAIDWFPQVRVRELSQAEINACDPSGRTFRNINTLEDFIEAERLAELDELSGRRHGNK